MKLLTFLPAAAAALTMAMPLSAAQTAVEIDGDEITISGCVVPSSGPAAAALPGMLVWSRSGLMMAAATLASAPAPGPVGTSGVAGRVFYWMDEDLSEYVGQHVEVEGELEDVETGELEMERDGDFTEIHLDIDGVEETARVPTAWLLINDREVDAEIVAREIDVEEVHVIGACQR